MGSDKVFHNFLFCEKLCLRGSLFLFGFSGTSLFPLFFRGRIRRRVGIRPSLFGNEFLGWFVEDFDDGFSKAKKRLLNVVFWKDVGILKSDIRKLHVFENEGVDVLIREHCRQNRRQVGVPFFLHEGLDVFLKALEFLLIETTVFQKDALVLEGRLQEVFRLLNE